MMSDEIYSFLSHHIPVGEYMKKYAQTDENIFKYHLKVDKVCVVGYHWKGLTEDYRT